VNKVDSTIFSNICDGMKSVNSKVLKGELVTDENLMVHLKDTKYSIQELNGLYFYWWGWKMCINEYWTQQIAYGLAVGSGATWVAAELVAAGIVTSPGSIPLGLVAAILATGSAGIF
jgi:hypothetical protein